MSVGMAKSTAMVATDKNNLDHANSKNIQLNL